MHPKSDAGTFLCRKWP